MISYKRKMTPIDANSVDAKNIANFPYKGRSGSFNAIGSRYSVHVICVDALQVKKALKLNDRRQTDALRLDQLCKGTPTLSSFIILDEKSSIDSTDPMNVRPSRLLLNDRAKVKLGGCELKAKCHLAPRFLVHVKDIVNDRATANVEDLVSTIGSGSFQTGTSA